MAGLLLHVLHGHLLLDSRDARRKVESLVLAKRELDVGILGIIDCRVVIRDWG